jgi:hypothetical membrane protein
MTGRIGRRSMSKPSSRFIIVAAIAGLLAFIGDFLVTIVLGSFYPGYNHLTLVMSELGTFQSPVATWINLWWIIGGVLFCAFAVGFRMAFAAHRKSATLVMALIVLFGLGAWICGGLFPMEPGGVETTLAGRLHGACGGLGYLALAFVPLASLAIFPKGRSPRLHRLSIGVFVLGLASFGLFIAAEDVASTGNLLSYAGLWQRLFLLDHYAYLGVISGLMIRSARRSAQAA